MIEGKFFTVVENLLSADECNAFIGRFDTADKLSTVDRGMAIYDRHTFRDDALAALVHRRLYTILPAAIRDSTAINPHFRFSKYLENGFFDVHRDGMNQDERGRRTIYTVNIFLNTGFQGGETDFLNEARTLVHRATPAIGRAAVFDVNILHRGNKVTGGYKFLLRTDVML
jgi:predicted 2-oxoglutarate/Fe(II)-dependent dioxygenase YbiX